MFYGREKEIAYLEEVYATQKAEFITIYGRRRIGKTELLKKFTQGKESIFYSAKLCTDYEQLLSFSEKILGKGKQFKNWETAFEHIRKCSQDNRFVVVLDEFPYMVKVNKGLPSIIQNLWDHSLSHSNLMLIICGSSMSFIEKDVLSEKNPLYGRMTGIYKVEELSLTETRPFFEEYTIEQLIQAYSILGGVPYYYAQFDVEQDIKENIKRYILNKGRVLYNEVDLLIKQELREPQVYYTIIEKIAMGNTKLNDIYNKTLIEKNKLSVYLKNLIELNIIKKEYPVTEKLKAKVNLHLGLYKLSSNFFDFYFRFVFPNLSDLEEGDIQGIYDYEVAPFLNDYTSKCFEELCIKYIRRESIEKRKPFRVKNIGRWWNKQDEIDIVGYDRGNNYIFGECKWRNEKVGISVLESLKDKVNLNFPNKKAYYYLFSKSGFTAELRELEKEDTYLEIIDLNMLI